MTFTSVALYSVSPGNLDIFQKNNSLLEEIQKCLEEYLESKRVIFPRCLCALTHAQQFLIRMLISLDAVP